MATVVFYGVGGINYAVFVTFVSVVMILLPSQVGGNPLTLAVDRWVDLMIGGVLTVIVMLLIPIWKQGQLATDMSSYLLASADWFESLGEACADSGGSGPDQDLAQCRDRGRQARRAGTVARATLRAATVEPNLRHLELVGASALLSAVGQVNECGVVVEARVAGFGAAGTGGSGELEQVAAALRAADGVLDQTSFDDSRVALAGALDHARVAVRQTAQ